MNIIFGMHTQVRNQETHDDKWAPVWLFLWLLKSEHENKSLFSGITHQ